MWQRLLLVALVACGSGHAEVRAPQAPPREVATWEAHYRVTRGHLIATAVITNDTSTDWTDEHVVLVMPDLKCPPEDIDGFEDDDGCQDPDNDQDGIPDDGDVCPMEPETYNDKDDEDGCPDRGRVITNETSIEILDQLFYRKNDFALTSTFDPILNAVAATLEGSPDILKLDIQGHISADESPHIGLWRAAGIRAALLARGVAPERLGLVDMATTQRLNPNNRSLERDRRVSFLIVERWKEPFARSMRPPTQPPPVAGAMTHGGAGLRFPLPAPLTVALGGSVSVPLFDRAIDATLERRVRQQVSLNFPVVEVTFTNTTGQTMPPGRIKADGIAAVTDGYIADAIPPGTSTTIRLGADRATSLGPKQSVVVKPTKIAEIRGDQMEVEDEAITTTTFTVSPPGVVVVGLDPVVTSSPERRTIDLRDRRQDVAPYLTTPSLPSNVADALRVALDTRRELVDADHAVQVVADQITSTYREKPSALIPHLDAATARADALREKLQLQLKVLAYP